MKMIINRLKANNKSFANLTIRTGFFLVVLFALIGIFVIGTRHYRTELREGDIAVRDIFAPFDFTYYGEIDEGATEQLRQKAADETNLIYDFDEEARQAPSVYINNLFKTLESIKKEDIINEERIAKLRNAFPEVKESSLTALLEVENLDEVKTKMDGIINKIESSPIIPKSEHEALGQDKRTHITLRDLKEKKENVVKIDELIKADNIEKILINNLSDEYFKKDVRLKAAAQDLLKICVIANIKKNEDEFLRRSQEIKAKIPPVLKEMDIKKNEIILNKGERVKKHHLLQLEKIFGKEVSEKEGIGEHLSMAAILFIMLFITVVSLKRYNPTVYNNNSHLLLVAIIAILFLIGARLITISFLSSYFIPIASASMLIAILLNENVAFLITLMLSIGCGIIVGNKLQMMIICLVGGVVGIYAVRGLRKRFQLLRAGILVGCTNFGIISSFGVLTNLQPNVFFAEAGKGFLNGIISSFIVMGMLPVFEYLFKIATDITLLELSDLNHPLLKNLTLKAPGTYHHSLLVGNLAEAACDAIGANSLLARVGAYYHDIGKTEKPEYFTENLVDTEKSGHDALSPSMSALVITSHVKEGEELAKKYKLNKAIVDFIQQHHGNTLIYYFYQRALEKVADETQLEEENFRYPGPKPQTKETAIVLLADAVEASSRTLSNPTPARIESLVRKIINNKFIDGQLDDCDLTLKDLNKIATSFARILTGVFHSRVEYPEAGEKQTQW